MSEMEVLLTPLVVKRLKAVLSREVLLYLFIGIKLAHFNTSFLTIIYTVCMPHIHRFTVVDTVFIIIQILVKVNGAK